MDSVLNSYLPKITCLAAHVARRVEHQPSTQWKDLLSRPFTSRAEGFACFHLYSQKMHDTQITTNGTKNRFISKNNSRYYHDNGSLEQDFLCCPIAFALYDLEHFCIAIRKDVHFETDCGFQLIASWGKKNSYLTIFSQLAQNLRTTTKFTTWLYFVCRGWRHHDDENYWSRLRTTL